MSIGERGGVCKDIAGACITLMRAAGYEVYPAQTQALFPVNRVPADQFDHCVVAWRKPDGTWEMLDPTWAPYSMNIWDTAEAQQNYLIGTPEGEDLGQTKLFTPEESKMTIQTSSSLAEDGTLTGQVRWLGLGRSDSIHRSMRAMQPAVGADRAYQRILESIDPGVEILKAEHTDEEDLYKSYENNVEYRIANYAFVDNGEMSFHIPLARLIRAPQMARYLSMANTPERKFDLFVIFLQLVESEEILTIPDGYELAGKPVKVKIVKDTAEYEAALTEVDGKLKFTARFIIKVRTITKEQYKEFKELTDKAKAVAERWITLRRKPGHGVK